MFLESGILARYGRVDTGTFEITELVSAGKWRFENVPLEVKTESREPWAEMTLKDRQPTLSLSGFPFYCSKCPFIPTPSFWSSIYNFVIFFLRASG